MASEEELEQAADQFAKQHVVNDSMLPESLRRPLLRAAGQQQQQQPAAGLSTSTLPEQAPAGSAPGPADRCHASEQMVQQQAWPQQPPAAPGPGLRGWLRQYSAITRRDWLAMTRNPADVAGRMLVRACAAQRAASPQLHALLLPCFAVGSTASSGVPPY
jgi:hypothetical protein